MSSKIFRFLKSTQIINANPKCEAPISFDTHILRFIDGIVSKDCKADQMLAPKVPVEEAYKAVWKEVVTI